MYSPDEYEILAEVCSVACITILSIIFGRKVASIEGRVYYIRGLLLALYGCSWAIALIGCMLTSTNNGNSISCSLAFFNISLIYTVTKVILYLYWIEKLYIISMPKISRFRSFSYNFNVILMVPYIALAVLMVYYRVIYVSENTPYHCWIGYRLPASITVLSYDIFVTLMFTGMFAKHYFMPSQAQQGSPFAMALSITTGRNTIIGLVALVTALVKYCLTIIYQDGLRGLIATCVTTLDVTIVSCVVHWVTTHPAETQFMDRILPQQSNNEKPLKLEIKQHQEVVVLTELSSSKA
ncbi:hypothetical protein BCR42DRAFT_419790 [Absidia repens]|uniref:G-protein coupled receptors family 2 profile 2 domain-containing protein n=1 Tax=Absidia repens TaxID=90262 RepID=A0A1X2IBR1_9FUNG|nr:hypothetical protein BCR42DRAFT_419790 [Absidia repens]